MVKKKINAPISSTGFIILRERGRQAFFEGKECPYDPKVHPNEYAVWQVGFNDVHNKCDV